MDRNDLLKEIMSLKNKLMSIAVSSSKINEKELINYSTSIDILINEYHKISINNI